MSTRIDLYGERFELSMRQINTLPQLASGPVIANVLNAKALRKFARQGWAERVEGEAKAYRITWRGELAAKALQEARAAKKAAAAEVPPPPAQLSLGGVS